MSKAMRDGEYVAKRGVVFDLRCFFGTFAKLFTGAGVVENTVPEPSTNNKTAISNTETTSVENSQTASKEEKKGAVA